MEDASVELDADTQADADLDADAHADADLDAGADGDVGCVEDDTPCGACGTCAGGECRPTTLSASGYPTLVSIDDVNVYWGDRAVAPVGSLWSVPRVGGLSVALAGELITPSSAVSDGTTVYFLDYGGQSLKSVPVAGGMVTELVMPRAPSMVILDSGYVLYAESGAPISGFPGSLGRYTIATDDDEALSSGGSPFQLASDGVNVYWTDTYARTVSSVAIAGGSVDVLTTLTEETPQSIVVDSSRIYFSTQEGGIYAMPLEGGEIETLASDLPWPLSLALADGHLYVANWSNGDGVGGSVVRLPTSGGMPTPLASGMSVYGVAVDDACVYATVLSPGRTVIRLDR